MNPNDAVASTLQDLLVQLGNIPADRIRMTPKPGTATPDDCIAVNDGDEKAMCELVDGTLVEKAMGYEASVVAGTILAILRDYAASNRLGLISGADGFFQLQSSTRGPDVAFLNRDRLPQGVFSRGSPPHCFS